MQLEKGGNSTLKIKRIFLARKKISRAEAERETGRKSKFGSGAGRSEGIIFPIREVIK